MNLNQLPHTHTDLQVWDAIISWRNNLLKKDILRKSKIDYLSNMEKLIERNILDLEQPLSEFNQCQLSNKLKFIDGIAGWSPSTKKARRTLLRSFYEFSKKKIKKTDIEIPFDEDENESRSLKMLAISELLSENKDKARAQHLTLKDFNNFFLNLRDIHSRDFLICRLMWELKCTIHDILNLSITDIDFSKGIYTPNNKKRFGNMRPDLLKLFQTQCEGKTGLIFHTDKGKKIHPTQLVRSMKTASQLAKLPIIISPKIIYTHSQAHYDRVIASMSDEEYNKMFAELRVLLVLSSDEKLKNVFEK